MKVCLITSADEKCGIAEYGRSLMRSLPQIEWTVIGHDCVPSIGILGGFDLVVLNYEPGLFPHFHHRMFASSQKRLLILHTSHEGNNATLFTSWFDRVVVHEKTTEGFTRIPMGVPEPLNHEERAEVQEWMRIGLLYQLGSAGIPFPWKGFPEVSDAARLMKGNAFIVAPATHHSADWLAIAQLCRDRGATVATAWADERKVMKLLSCCNVLVFAYHGGNYGISGAVRLGIATGRPLVVTRGRMFRDLLEDYADEIEVAESPDPAEIVRAVERVLANGKHPSRMIDEMKWSVVGQAYLKVFEEIVGHAASLQSVPAVPSV